MQVDSGICAAIGLLDGIDQIGKASWSGQKEIEITLIIGKVCLIMVNGLQAGYVSDNLLGYTSEVRVQ